MILAIQKNIVKQSFDYLRSQKIHTLFAGYLYLQQRSSQLGRLTDLQPEFLPFFKKFFFVLNHPLGTPYIKPFTEQKASMKNLWLNDNIAGSYAPSSLRSNQPFRQVVEVQDKIYSLPENHTIRALEHLLYYKKINVMHLAIFLYRDFGFFSENFSLKNLIQTFSYEFGYSNDIDSTPNENFFNIFFTEDDLFFKSDILEKI